MTSSDAKRLIFPEASGHLLRRSHERGAGAAAHESHTRPEIGANDEPIPPAAMQFRHTALADRVHLCGKARLRAGDLLVRNLRDEFVRGGPGLLLGLAHNEVQANAEAHGTADRRSPLPDSRDLLGDLRRTFAPRQEDVDLFRSQIHPRF